MENELIGIITKLDDVARNLMHKGAYIDSLVFIKRMVSKYDKHKYLEQADILELCESELIDMYSDRDNTDDKFNIKTLMNKVNWELMLELHENEESVMPEVRKWVLSNIERCVEVYKKKTEYEIRFCNRCGVLLYPGSMAYDEGFHFDSCI